MRSPSRSVLALVLTFAAGCGGGTAEAPLPVEGGGAPPPPDPYAQPQVAPVDLTQVVWPATPPTLPVDVPWWANDFNQPGHSPTHRPTLPDAWSQHGRLSAPSRPGNLGPTVIYCEWSYASRTDDPTPVFRNAQRAQADLTVLGRIGTGLAFQAIAPNNVESFAFGVPVTGLRVGDVVSMSAVDRDFVEHDEVGALTATYAGELPLRLGSGDLTATCVAEAQGVIPSYAPSLLAAADQAIARHIVTPAVRVGVPRVTWADFEEARATVSFAADWLTWSSPDVQLRRARLDALLRDHEAERTEAFAALVASLASHTEVQLSSGGWLRAVAVSCGSRPGSIGDVCQAQLALRAAPIVPALQGQAFTRARDGRLAYVSSLVETIPAGERQLGIDLAGFDAYILSHEGPVILELRESPSGSAVLLLLPPLSDAR